MNDINTQTDQFEAIQELRCLVPPCSPVPDISEVACDRVPAQDGPLNGAPDWLIEIRSPDQSTLDLQAKILHCLSNGPQLAWLIDLTQQQVWVWQNRELPLIYAEADRLPTLAKLPQLTVHALLSMTQQ